MSEMMNFLVAALLPVAYAFVTVHLIAIVVNYGFIYAALYRNDLAIARKNIVRNTLMAALLCLPGIFSTFFLLKDANVLKYGIKFWPVETERFSKKWHKREEIAIYKKYHPEPYRRPRPSNGSGRCHSIW